MVSTRTENRSKKVSILRESCIMLMDIHRWDMKDLDKVNMAKFKELDRIVKEISETKKTTQAPFGIFTQDDKIAE